MAGRQDAQELFDEMEQQSCFKTGYGRYKLWWKRQSERERAVRFLVVIGACLTVAFSAVNVICGDTLCHPRSNKGYASFTNWAAFAIGMTVLTASLLEKIPMKTELDKAEPQGIVAGGSLV